MKITEILKMVQEESPLDNIAKDTRKREYVEWRFIFYKLAWKYAEDYTSYAAAKAVGRTNHAGVLHGLKLFDYNIDTPDWHRKKRAFERIGGFLKNNQRLRKQLRATRYSRNLTNRAYI